MCVRMEGGDGSDWGQLRIKSGDIMTTRFLQDIYRITEPLGRFNIHGY